MIFGGLTIDSSVLGKLGQHNVGVIIINGLKHEPVLFFPRPHNDACKRLRQYMVVADKSSSLSCARKLIGEKILQQRELLSAERLISTRHQRELQLSIEEIGSILANLNSYDDFSSLLGAEGAAANAYFHGIASVLPASLKFQGRNLRPPKDPFNSVLSLCYTLLYAEAQLLIYEQGYDPFLGIHHKPHFGRASLACDIMEPVRPFVDRFAINAFRQKILRIEDFTTSDKGCLIGKAGRARLYPTWNEHLPQARNLLLNILKNIESFFKQQNPNLLHSIN